MTAGVILMSFGTAASVEDVPEFLRSVRGGSDPDPALVTTFQERFRSIGGSPLIEITRRQAEALQRRLDESHGAGAFRVAIGMQHSAPRISDTARELVEAGCNPLLGIAMAPQYSPVILAGYERAFEQVRRGHPGVDAAVAGAWHDLEPWIESLAERTEEALAALPTGRAEAIPVVFTAHSLPRSVIERDPGYVEQLKETARPLAARLGLAGPRWRFAWQSAGHTPAEWLRPDLTEVLAEVAAEGHPDVLIVPVQFLADHLEILYDIDVAAREQAEAAGVELRRIAMPNDSARLVEALAAVVERELAGTGAGA